MFGISLEELIVLAVLAFILFGPQKLPEYAEKLGRLVAKLRQASSELTREVQNPFQYPPEPGQSTPQVTGYPTCSSCHRVIGPDFTFCPHCGHRLKEEPAASASPQQPLAS
ncbi:MAG TPA: twin-arginine translocase TatA/TatE family subunit [Desulfobaccales bacterium]|jgi:TatA/E family protein of Tat protein translocase